jgi:hypothetical protein
MKSRHFSALVAMLLLAPAGWAGGEANTSVTGPASADSQTQPKNPCSVPCLVMRVSSTARCECNLRKTLPA